MNNLNIVNIEKVEILPLNPPSNNAFSFKEGFPIVQFLIPNQAKLLSGSSMRLNGVLRLCQPASTEAAPSLPNNKGNKTGTAFNCALSSRIGVASAIDQITLSSMTNQTLEVVRSYGRYLASAQSVTHSQDDLDTNVSVESLTSSRSLNGGFGINNDVSFSIPLRSGLLSGGQEIPIGTNGIRGMLVQLQLAPDSQVLGGWVDNAGANQNNAGDGTGAFYQMRNLTLSYNLLVPDEAGTQLMTNPSTGSLTYNAISHLYSVINSSDQTANYNLGTGKTLSVFHNFLPTTHLNNYSQDGFGTPKLQNATVGVYDSEAQIQRVSFLKGGVQFPVENDINVATPAENGRPLSELEINYINSIKSYSTMNHSLISLNTQNSLPTNVNALNGLDTSKFTQAENKPVFGIGVAEDPYRVGVDFKNTNYGLRIVSDLNGTSPNSVFTYVLAQNTLMYSPQGISIMS
tara:strand:+ start:2153 stop:3529 length:1377 start_codon:yes stop_codon:yes gene_type:complete